MRTISGILALILLGGCASAQAPVSRWTWADGGWVQTVSGGQPEPWYRWLYCGAFGSTPCVGDKPGWAKAIEVLGAVSDASIAARDGAAAIKGVK